MSNRLVLDVACSVTARDRQILRRLRWHRVPCHYQPDPRLFFGDRNTALHRLVCLYQLRLIERFGPASPTDTLAVPATTAVKVPEALPGSAASAG